MQDEVGNVLKRTSNTNRKPAERKDVEQTSTSRKWIGAVVRMERNRNGEQR